MPKFDKTKKTVPNATMTINFTLTGTGTDLQNAGLDPDGVVPIPGATKKGTVKMVPLQFAAIVAGMSYQSIITVPYTANSDFGTMTGRK